MLINRPRCGTASKRKKKQQVAYASRTLTEAEEGCPQIDKKLLAIVYECENFIPMPMDDPSMYKLTINHQ